MFKYIFDSGLDIAGEVLEINEMGKIKGFPTVTTIAVVLTITFYTIFTNYVSPMLSTIPGLAGIVGLLASTGFYLALFQFLLWVYFKFLQDRLNPKEAISGEWFYKLEVNGSKEQIYGLCHIEKEGGELSVNGIHYNPSKKKFTSRFISDFVILEKNELVILYNSVGVDEEIFIRKGTAFFTTEGVPPKRIYGVWTDLLPNKNAGEMVMQRRDAETDKLIDQMGFPKNAPIFEQSFSTSKRTNTTSPKK